MKGIGPPCGKGDGKGMDFVGCIMSFNQNSGFGFISCSETHSLYGRDVFLPKAELGEFWMGDTVLFQVELDAKGGMPKAKHLRPMPGQQRPPPKGGAGAQEFGGKGGAGPGGPPGGCGGKGGPSADEIMLQQMLLEQQQEKEQLMSLQMQVTQVVVQAAMAKQQAAEQEAMMAQQLALMQSPDAAQEQQQLMQQQMMQQMQQQMLMAQSMVTAPTAMGQMGQMGMGAHQHAMGQMGMGAAPQMVAPPPDFDMEKRYVGVIKSFNTAKGVGFVDCPEIMEKFGCDVFLHASQILNDEEVGDVISFTVQLGRLGQPRAKDIQAIGSVQDTEMEAPNQVYTGTVKSFNQEKGYGFIVCAETFGQYQSDVFFHKDQAKGINIGDSAKFTLRLSLKGQPQAKDMEKAPEAAQLTALGGAPHLPAPGEGFKPIMGRHMDLPSADRSVPYTKAAGMTVPPPPAGTFGNLPPPPMLGGMGGPPTSVPAAFGGPLGGHHPKVMPPRRP